MKKTNAARALDRLKLSYELRCYPVDEQDLSVDHVAQSMGIENCMLFKTLVTLNEHHQPIIAVIPGDKTLDLKALASAAGCKKCTMLPMKDLQKTTGYIRGGCSPLAMKKSYPTYIDHHALDHEKIYISAGIRGKQLLLEPIVLIQAAKALSVALV